MRNPRIVARCSAAAAVHGGGLVCGCGVWVVASTSDASEIADRREPSQRVLDLVVFNQQ